METVRSALWRQFGAAIDTLDNMLAACPDTLWTERVWPAPPPSWFPAQFAEFWYVGYHTLVWLDLYLAGLPEERFAPPAPFAQGEVDSHEALPERPYPKEQLRAYLATLREKCRAALAGLTEDEACRPVEYPWSAGQPVSYLEPLFYTLRHVQEHAAHLSLFLGQRGVPDEALDWVARAQDDLGDR